MKNQLKKPTEKNKFEDSLFSPFPEVILGVFYLAEQAQTLGIILMLLGIFITLTSTVVGVLQIYPPSKEIGFFLLLIGFFLSLTKR